MLDADKSLWDRLYVSGATLCAYIDAKDEAAAWDVVGLAFPDYQERFIKLRNDGTLVGAARGGRFRHPVKDPPKRVLLLVDVGQPLMLFPDHYGPCSEKVYAFGRHMGFHFRERWELKTMKTQEAIHFVEFLQLFRERVGWEIETLPDHKPFLETQKLPE